MKKEQIGPTRRSDQARPLSLHLPHVFFSLYHYVGLRNRVVCFLRRVPRKWTLRQKKTKKDAYQHLLKQTNLWSAKAIVSNAEFSDIYLKI